MKIYKSILLSALKDLSSLDYQEKVWMNRGKMDGISISYTEAINNVFADSLIEKPLEAGDILFDQNVTLALKEFDKLTEEIDEFGISTWDFIHSEDMQRVRDKAKMILYLVSISSLEDNSLIFIELGESPIS